MKIVCAKKEEASFGKEKEKEKGFLVSLKLANGQKK